MQIQAARSEKLYSSRSGNVGVGTDNVHLLNACNLVADREAKRPIVMQLDVLHVCLELIDIGFYPDIPGTLERSTQHESSGDG